MCLNIFNVHVFLLVNAVIVSLRLLNAKRAYYLDIIFLLKRVFKCVVSKIHHQGILSNWLNMAAKLIWEIRTE